MSELPTIDFTNGVELTPEEVLACSLENPEYCEACQWLDS